MSGTSSFKRILTTGDCTNLILGVMLGTGILSTFPALVAMHLPSPWLIMLVWVLGGLLAWSGAVCYAELAALFPSSGGDYAYLRAIYSVRGESVIAFLFGWTTLFIIRPSSIAILALIFSSEIGKVLPFHATEPVILACAIGVVIVLTSVNALSLHVGKNTQNIYSIMMVGILVFIILYGLFFAAAPAMVSPPPSPTPPQGGLQMVVSVFRALILCMWVYGGWNEAVYVVEEAREPARSIPRALFRGIVCVTVLYLGMHAVYLAQFGATGLARTFNPASSLMGTWFGQAGSTITSGIIAAAAISSINGLIITGGRFSRAIAVDYPRLRQWGALHDRRGTPVRALIANALITIAMLLVSTGRIAFIENLTFYTSGVFWSFFAMAVLGLVILRFRLPVQDRDPRYRSWFFTVNPLLFLVIIGGLIWGSIEFKPTETLSGIAMLTLGIPIYYILRIGDRRSTLRPGRKGLPKQDVMSNNYYSGN